MGESTTALGVRFSANELSYETDVSMRVRHWLKQSVLDYTLNVIKRLATLARSGTKRHQMEVEAAECSPKLQMSLSLPNDNYTQPIKTPL